MQKQDWQIAAIYVAVLTITLVAIYFNP